MIVTVGRSVKVKSVESRDLGNIELSVKPDGSGNILFTESETEVNGRRLADGFYGIQKVKYVEELIREVLRSDKAENSTA